jgi:aspartate aminotransferase
MSITTSTPQEAEAVASQLKIIARPMYSNPPVNGSRIATEVNTYSRVQSAETG